ncbi:hypothetical protein BmHoA_00547 [Borrelia miyamotoi]|uniref:hypothetical protein n=1 Tax=Borrelia miyamotoi TaxID=47466 RepID=UPI001C788EA7|nr:hypothetical protein [Borrelia miyamotoi]BCR19483.1 hypothetical protein BmHoA_00547 [Borrelia miyamotoi]BCR20316.1 hypothetical protein BmHoB_00548 [Borrelia miyamotoi]
MNTCYDWKNILAILVLLANYQALYENKNKKNSLIINGNKTVTYCNKKAVSCCIILNLQINENASIEINTQDKNFSYDIPKIVNQDKELTIEIKMDNIKSIRLNNAKIKNSNIQTARSSLQKFKILISQNEYSIEFNLTKNMFPILGFKAKEKISSPILANLYSEKESQKIVLSNLIKYTSLENENDKIKSTKNNNMIQILEIGYINMNAYYDINKPINSDLKFILNYKKENYRRDAFELFNLISEPNIYVLKFKNLKYQSLMLKRIAFFIEKKEFRGVLLSNNELKNKIGWRGHDYRLQDIITFFNKAQKLNIKLNKEEIILKNLIIINKLAYIENNTIKIKDKSKNIAFAAYSEDETILSMDQITIFMHEILHMYYFIDKNFNKAISNFWSKNVIQKDKQAWIQFLDSKDYDTNYQYLIINEFYAYITQLPKEETATYLINTNYFPKFGLNRYDKWAKKLEALLWETKGLIAGELLILFKDKIKKEQNM